jgi:hypothetical protein
VNQSRQLIDSCRFGDIHTQEEGVRITRTGSTTICHNPNPGTFLNNLSRPIFGIENNQIKSEFSSPSEPKQLYSSNAKLGLKKLIKHDRYLESLCSEIGPRYDVVLRNVPLYSVRNRLIGEIDVLAIKDNYCDIYEVKCSYRIHKARRQLRKIKKILSLESQVRNLFFFCGASGALETV